MSERPCCAIGARADAGAIDAELRAGEGLGTVAKRHGLVKGTLGRHRKFCLQILVGQAAPAQTVAQPPLPAVPIRQPGRRQDDLEEMDQDLLEGVVYFIQEGKDGPIKIGKTKNAVAERRKERQTGNSRKLRVIAVLPGYTLTEGSLHRKFESLRAGGEWFHPGNELLVFVSHVRATIGGMRGTLTFGGGRQ